MGSCKRQLRQRAALVMAGVERLCGRLPRVVTWSGLRGIDLREVLGLRGNGLRENGLRGNDLTDGGRRVNALEMRRSEAGAPMHGTLGVAPREEKGAQSYSHQLDND